MQPLPRIPEQSPFIDSLLAQSFFFSALRSRALTWLTAASGYSMRENAPPEKYFFESYTPSPPRGSAALSTLNDLSFPFFFLPSRTQLTQVTPPAVNPGKGGFSSRSNIFFLLMTAFPLCTGSKAAGDFFFYGPPFVCFSPLLDAKMRSKLNSFSITKVSPPPSVTNRGP